MTASKRSMDRPSDEGLGETDLARMDAHQITAEEYDEIPELTDEMIARAVPGNGEELARRSRGRPRADSPKRQVTLRLDADVIEAMRASGPGWQVRANAALRDTFKRLSAAEQIEALDQKARRIASERVAGRRRDA